MSTPRPVDEFAGVPEPEALGASASYPADPTVGVGCGAAETAMATAVAVAVAGRRRQFRPHARAGARCGPWSWAPW